MSYHINNKERKLTPWSNPLLHGEVDTSAQINDKFLNDRKKIKKGWFI
jgi:hypothetical protein